MLGPRVNALSPRAACARRFRPGRRTAADAARTSRWERVAHCGHAPPGRGPRPDPRLPAARSACRSSASSRACPDAVDLPAGRREPRRLRRAPDRVPAGRDDARSSSSPTSTGDPTIADNIRPLARLRRRRSTRSRASTGSRARSRLHDPATGAALTPEQVAALYAAARRPAPARASTPLAALQQLRPRLDRPPRRDQPARRRAARRRPSLIPTIRAVDAGDGHHDRRSAAAAAIGHDFLASQAERRRMRSG